MANSFLNVSWISMDVLRLLLNKLTVAEYFNHDYEKEFKKEFAPGSSISVKFPQRFLTVDGMGYAPQAVNRLSTSISLDQWIQVPFEWDDYEQAVKLERSESEIREQYLEPAAAAISQEWDSRAAKFAYQNASGVVGALGTDSTKVDEYYDARSYLMQKSCPPSGPRAMIVSTSMMATLGKNITNLFHPGDEVKQAWKDGYIGKMAGFDWYESNSLYSHTAGTWNAAGITVTSAAADGATSIAITCTAGDTLKKGDKFAILNVNAVNPMTRRIAGPATKQSFTVTKDFTGVGGGDAADILNFLPAVYGPNHQYQNVDALPAAGATLTLWPGTTAPSGKVGTVGLALSKYAFALVGARVYTPKAVEAASQKQDPKTGLAVRFVKAWDPVRSMNIHRFDSLGGFGNLYQDNGAVCVAGA